MKLRFAKKGELVEFVTPDKILLHGFKNIFQDCSEKRESFV